MDKQREEFEKLLGNEFDPEGIYWEWFKKGQTAMQPEIAEWKNKWASEKGASHNLIAAKKMRDRALEELSAANQRIAELEKDYAVWREYTGKVNDRNIELEERIRVADAEEPVDAIEVSDCAEVSLSDYGRCYAGSIDCVKQLYAHAQMPAEVELKAKIAELEATIAGVTGAELAERPR